jgi:hypothetical protein
MMVVRVQTFVALLSLFAAFFWSKTTKGFGGCVNFCAK